MIGLTDLPTPSTRHQLERAIRAPRYPLRVRATWIIVLDLEGELCVHTGVVAEAAEFCQNEQSPSPKRGRLSL